MQAVDTTLLVRLFVNDDAPQAAKVRALFDKQADEDGSLWVADIVLVELAWTLERTHGRSRSEISAALHALSGNATVQLESPAHVASATALFQARPADFADCLLAVKAASVGCDSLRTFDKKMRALPGAKLL